MEITRRAEAGLADSEPRYRDLIAGFPLPLYTTDAEGFLTLYNEAATGLWGRRPVLGKDRWCGFLKMFQPDGTPVSPEQCPMAVCLRESREVRGVELEAERPDGTRLTFMPYPTPLRDASGEFVGAMNVLVDITEQRQAAQDLARAHSQLSEDLSRMTRLHEAGMLFVENRDLVELLEHLLDAAMEISGSDMGNVRLHDEQTGTMRIVAHRGFDEAFIQAFRAVSVEEAKASGMVLNSGNRMIIPDVARSPVFAGRPAGELLLAAGVRSIVSTPMFTRGGHCVGVFSTHYRTPHRQPDERALRLLDILSRQAADFVERAAREEALSKSEQTLRAILETAADAIITIDRDGKVISANPATGKMFGYAGNELLGQNVNVLMPRPSREGGAVHVLGVGREVEGRRKNGEIFPVELAVSEVDHLGIFAWVLRDISERRRMEAEVVRASEEEQTRIAADLHDSLGSLLTGISLHLGGLVERLRAEGHPEAGQAALTHEHTLAAIQQCRPLVRGLHPVDANDPNAFTNALHGLAKFTQNSWKGECVFYPPKGPVPIRESLVLNSLYRIAQEAVNNAVKHSQANRIEVRLVTKPKLVELSVSDDGMAFDPLSRRTGCSGLGLRLMEYRARLIGAKLSIDSPRQRTGGTLVRCVRPVQGLESTD